MRARQTKEQRKKLRTENGIKDKPGTSEKVKNGIEEGKDRGLKTNLTRLSVFATAPKTFRLPEILVYLLEYRARQLNTTPGKLLRELLKETFPMFEEEQVLQISVIKKFHQLQRSGGLQSVDADALFDEIRAISTLRAEGRSYL
jgi:hypothetical protein